MIRDPRVVFDKLFSVAQGRDHAGGAARSGSRRIAASSTGCWRRSRACRSRWGRPIARGWPTISIRSAKSSVAFRVVEARNRSGELRELPASPIGVPDSFSEHVKLMFDLQVLAFASDLTRVFAFKLGRDASNRTYPESGFNGHVPRNVASRRA